MSIEVTHQLLVEVYLYHALDGITDVHKLEELQQRSDAPRLLMFRWLIGPHLLLCPAGRSVSTVHALLSLESYSRIKTGLYMTLTERLQEQNEDLFDGVTNTMSVLSGIPREGLHAFERFAVGVNEFKRHVE